MLAVVGAVLGTIWVAAAKVRDTWRMNERANSLLRIAEEMRRFFPYANYPTTPGGLLHVEQTLAAAGKLPDFYLPGYSTVDRGGFQSFIYLHCGTGQIKCPTIWIEEAWVFENSGGRYLKPSECTQLVRKVATYSKPGSGLYRIHAGIPSNYGYYVLTPPFDVSNFSCPSSISSQWVLNFYWEP